MTKLWNVFDIIWILTNLYRRLRWNYEGFTRLQTTRESMLECCDKLWREIVTGKIVVFGSRLFLRLLGTCFCFPSFFLEMMLICYLLNCPWQIVRYILSYIRLFEKHSSLKYLEYIHKSIFEWMIKYLKREYMLTFL